VNLGIPLYPMGTLLHSCARATHSSQITLAFLVVVVVVVVRAVERKQAMTQLIRLIRDDRHTGGDLCHHFKTLLLLLLETLADVNVCSHFL